MVEKYKNELMDMEQIAGLRKRIVGAVDLTQYSLLWDLLLLGAVTLVVVAVSYGSWRKKVANLPPGPRNWPLIGALLEMEPVMHKAYEKFATKYGPIVHFRLGVQTLVIVSSAEAAEDLLKHRDAEFSDRATAMTRSMAKYMGIDSAGFSFSNYDAEFKLQRKILISEIMTVAKLKSHERLRTQEVTAMMEKIFRVIERSDGREAHNSPNGSAATVGIRSMVLAMTRNIIFSLAIGKRFDSLQPTDELTEFPDLLDSFTEIFMSFNPVDYFPWLTWLDPQGKLRKMKKMEKRQRRFYEMILRRHRQGMKQKRESGTSEGADEGSSMNLLDVLLRAQEDGTKITDHKVMGTIYTMLVAGMDSTSSQVEWVLLELARHPKILQRLQSELDAFVGKERLVEEADLPPMSFLNAVILETLRLHPIVPATFPHVNMQPSTLCGYKIPAKTAVIINCYSIGRDPKSWTDPLLFNPDRFMAGRSSLSSAPIKANGNDYNLLPFGSGRRECPGYNLAIVLLLRTVGSLVHAFDWAPPPGCSPKDLSIEEEGSFVLHSSPSLYLVPTPRLQSNVYKSNIPSPKPAQIC